MVGSPPESRYRQPSTRLAAVKRGWTMALSVIGAGFGRTGTESMKLALEAFGMGQGHHMKGALSNPDQVALWRSVAGGRLPN